MAKKRTTARSKQDANLISSDSQSSLNANSQGDSAPQEQNLGLDSILGAVLGGGSQQNMPQQAGNDPLSSILGSMMGGDTQQQMPSSAMGAQAGGLDLGSVLGGLLGGGLGGGNMQSGMIGGAAGAVLGPLADSISEKTGLPKAIVMAGAAFLLSKLLSGGQQGAPTGSMPQLPQQQDTQAGGIDLGSILGGLLGGGNMGGAMPQQQMPQQGGQAGGIDLGSILGSILGGGMGGAQPQQDDTAYPDPQAQQQAPQQGGVQVPSNDKVLGKIGQAIGDAGTAQPSSQGGIRIQGLTPGNEHQFLKDNGLITEFAQQSGIDEHTAAQSLTAVLSALQGGQ